MYCFVLVFLHIYTEVFALSEDFRKITVFLIFKYFSIILYNSSLFPCQAAAKSDFEPHAFRQPKHGFKDLEPLKGYDYSNHLTLSQDKT